MIYDIAIIGAGVVGSAIARQLSKYNLNIALIEKENDVSCGASKANSGIVHGGYDAEPGTLKAVLNVKGNQMFDQLDAELHFGFRKCGSMVLSFSEADDAKIEMLIERGHKNGLHHLKHLSREAVLDIEPNLNPAVRGALLCEASGVTSPYEMTIALAENAVSNGVDLKLMHEVLSIDKTDNDFSIKTSQGPIHSKWIINAAGVFSDKVADMVGAKTFSITPRKGEYVLLNKIQGKKISRVIFQAPTDAGKGILVTRTYHGNLMLGPNAQEIQVRNDNDTDADILKHIVDTARKSLPDFDMKHVLTSFSGIRATSHNKDFIIEASPIKRFINVGGIDSPGLTSAPAIAEYVRDILIEEGLSLESKPDFDPERKAIIQSKTHGFDGQIDAPSPDKNIICRCEKVTEAEIVDAIHRGIDINSLDAIKRRTRAGMGPCQGQFCGPRVRKIISRETGLNEADILLRGKGSSILPQRPDRSTLKDL